MWKQKGSGIKREGVTLQVWSLGPDGAGLDQDRRRRRGDLAPEPHTSGTVMVAVELGAFLVCREML